ncbi:MAG TPA: thiamine-phosphate kinase [Candidatus Solibacter sp.]|nr:thiamine-phosphate kinase [Candidatus Solibacter sp.]
MKKGQSHFSTRRRAVSEDAVVKTIGGLAVQSGACRSGIQLGIGDDAALLRAAGARDEILTCDWFLEGTHFLRDKHSPDSVGWKCLARAVSDVAAMGGVPRCFLLSIALPAANTGHWLDQFLVGLRRASKRFGCSLVGGDTTRRNEILINVTVVGEVRRGRAVLRSQARPGDVLFVSGRLGEAELGLELIRKSSKPVDRRNPILQKHLYPEPRLELGRWLADRRLASAMMDLSDGLSSDLSRLAKASGVGALVEAVKIPAVRMPKEWHGRGALALELALHGGDDYELLFTVPCRKSKLIPRSFKGVHITAIGEITKGTDIVLIDKNGRVSTMANRGWDPFRQ